MTHVVGSFLPVSPSLTVADCPECRGSSTVILGRCSVCFAEFFEADGYLQPWRDQPPSPAPRRSPTEPALIPPWLSFLRESATRPEPVTQPRNSRGLSLLTSEGLVTGRTGSPRRTASCPLVREHAVLTVGGTLGRADKPRPGAFLVLHLATVPRIVWVRVLLGRCLSAGLRTGPEPAPFPLGWVGRRTVDLREC